MKSKLFIIMIVMLAFSACGKNDAGNDVFESENSQYHDNSKNDMDNSKDIGKYS